MCDRQQNQPPVSLGKPSLRRRLEAYYRLVAPHQLDDDWCSKYEQIYSKYGGSEEGEKKLAHKLAKKYGTTVRLQIVTSSPSSNRLSSRDSQSVSHRLHVLEKTSFELTELQRNSGVIDFTSERFDPEAAIHSSFEEMISTNPLIAESSMLDRVSHCNCLLPQSDPLYRAATRTPRRRETTVASIREKKQSPEHMLSRYLLRLMDPLKEGPFYVLYQAVCSRLRIRVLIRYVNGIRGTITGFITAFDKHFNLLLRDCEEVYSRRCTREDGLSNAERERSRRLAGIGSNAAIMNPGSWSTRRRNLKQLLVRGDIVVLVYLADEERSSTLYQKQSVEMVPPNEQVGSPGSLVDSSAIAE